MKHIYILACIISLGINTSTYAQNYPENKNTETDTLANTDIITASSKIEDETGLENAIFTASTKGTNYGGCSLIKNSYRERKIYTYNNGYKIVTGDEDETVRVKRYKDGGRKIKYSNDFETFKYHREQDGTLQYSYTYDNFECKKVKVRRNKKGITSVTNKSDINLDQVKGNVKTTMDTGVNSCFLVR